ncbi:arginine biosynthesis bifunctional protein ArgJ [Syncephalis plumigaleata]|nr:arginine biosynthesis bifunctional protein ArgJ [Syncephalis plumigaleata]
MAQTQASVSSKDRFIPSSGTYPQGYRLGAVHCGVKKSGLDLTLLVADKPCTAAAVFTRNAFPAAPVQFDRALLARHHANPTRHPIQAILVNSGCANAVTGTQGDKDAAAMAAAVNQQLSSSTNNSTSDATFIMSTGVIGQHLPMNRISAGVPNLYEHHLGYDHASWLAAAKGVCTTDTFPKLRSKRYQLPSGREYCLAGIAKGAGMIHPNMATMLSFMCTDAAIQADTLQRALSHAVDRSFNAISVDGDTSTNDTVALLANGAAWTSSNSLTTNDTDYPVFRDQLTEFSAELAQLVVRDGEGATKFITVAVKNAHDFDQAKTIASTICTSALVKTALYGQDANWGRVLCAIGYAPGSETTIHPERVSVTFKATAQPEQPLPVLRHGEPVPVDETFAAELLRNEDIEIHIDLGLGQESATMWTCDFSHDYVSINADYRS